jgi:hypothetical protein
MSTHGDPSVKDEASAAARRGSSAPRSNMDAPVTFAALSRIIRATHYENRTWDGNRTSTCAACRTPWPCATITALEQETR